MTRETFDDAAGRGGDTPDAGVETGGNTEVELDLQAEKPGQIVRLYGFNVVDLGGGALLILLGLAAAYEASSYGLGELSNIGPGFFPATLGFVLAGFGVAVMLEGPLSTAVLPPLPWRALGAIAGGLLLFGVLLERAGAVVAIFALIFVAGLAEKTFRPLHLLGIAIVLSIFMALLAYFFRGVVTVDLLPFGD